MDNIVNKIVDIEYKAQKIIKEAEQERDSLKTRIDGELEELREKTFSEAEARVKAQRSEKLGYARKEAQRIVLEAGQKSAAMEKSFAENRENWVSSLFNFVIGK